MESQNYPLPVGVHVIPSHFLDLRSDAEIDHDILHPKSVSDEKNVWFFWHSGFENMHPYSQRTIRAWHRRFSKQGWVISVLNRETSSPLNIVNYLDTTDPKTSPRAFIDDIVGGDYANQHTSDLVRFPLLLKYGGVYADVGLIQLGDIDRIWNEMVGNPESPIDVFGYYSPGAFGDPTIPNFFFVCGRNNVFFAQCHKLFLELWSADGGMTSTQGMHRSPLLKGVKKLGEIESFSTENGGTVNLKDNSLNLTDYAIQGLVLTMVMGLVDRESGWDGPKYIAEHFYGMEWMRCSQHYNDLTAWNGEKAFRLMSLPLPTTGEVESGEQIQAKKIVEGSLQGSFGLKLSHGFVLKVLGVTLGLLWREHEGSDDIPGTYAHWLRYGALYWCQDEIPPRVELQAGEPLKRGPLLREV
ncbi:putative glycosyl transferase FCK3 [Lachnellula suecica]|uniref:Putative glycosyl transferase FCK3 n=1 Tax=Lachnellula suecica TaxID=602035 RepID=A0A8T9CI19_9HELO|nr:putative glycosyl transferase FCK3 [Lachnellula suecica]